MRTYEIKRKTGETDISLNLNIDGSGKCDISTGCGFLDHMLTLLAHHGSFDIELSCKGDTYVDYHHTVEDIGICIGLAFKGALGDAKGIYRYGSMLLPMDESLVMVALDISGRAYLNCDLDIPTAKVGDFDTELTEEFFAAFVRSLGITLHIKQLEGKNSHHIIEACFKGVARALSAAVKIDENKKDSVPSSKGSLL